MLTDSDESLDRAFAALADRTRRAILLRLASGEAAAGELAAPFPVSAPAISRHLRVLESAGLVARRVDGKHRRLRLDPAALRTAAEWLDFYRRFWSGSFDELDEHLRNTKPRGTTQRKEKPDGHRKSRKRK